MISSDDSAIPLLMKWKDMGTLLYGAFTSPKVGAGATLVVASVVTQNRPMMVT